MTNRTGLVLRACGETPEHPSAVAVGRRLEGLLEAQPQKPLGSVHRGRNLGRGSTRKTR